MRGTTRTAIAVALMAVCVISMLPATPAGAVQTVYPAILYGSSAVDGTIVDGGLYGPCDGIPDDADWRFNETSYEGSITLTSDSGQPTLDRRVVWEYDLSGVTLAPPVSATLSFTLRGAPVFPFPDVDVHVYSYAADLAEQESDFSAGPAVLQGIATVVPYQDPTEYTLTVSTVVNDAMTAGEDMVAFRFQVDPNTADDSNQAFIDALDSDPATKPYLTIDEWVAPPGDFDGNGVVDLVDHGSFADCLSGPGAAPSPANGGVTPAMCLDAFDFDGDGDVDLANFEEFQRYCSGGPG